MRMKLIKLCSGLKTDRFWLYEDEIDEIRYAADKQWMNNAYIFINEDKIRYISDGLMTDAFYLYKDEADKIKHLRVRDGLITNKFYIYQDEADEIRHVADR